MIHLLHLDRDRDFLESLKEPFEEDSDKFSIDYIGLTSLESFWSYFVKASVDVVIVDADLVGPAMIGKVRQQGFAGPLFWTLTDPCAADITEAIASGASDCFARDLNDGDLVRRVFACLAHRDDLQSSSSAKFYAGDVMGHIHHRLKAVVRAGARSVLLTGESGTGKEIVSKSLQSELPKGTPFVAVNCGAIPSSLIESEFFGHEKGAFTGATQRRTGLFEQADGGWLFLDELARLPSVAQGALLRVIETGEICPVGALNRRNVDVRLIAATNEPLDDLVSAGVFRMDLLQRLRSYEISLPPFRERARSERIEIVDFLVRRLNDDMQRESEGDPDIEISEEVREVLADHPFAKGNLRELWHALQSMAIDAVGSFITLVHLPDNLRADIRLRVASVKNDVGQSTQMPRARLSVVGGSQDHEDCLKKISIPKMEQDLFSNQLALVTNLYGNDVSFSKLADLLGLTRWSLRSRINRLVKQELLPSHLHYLASNQK